MNAWMYACMPACIQSCACAVHIKSQQAAVRPAMRPHSGSGSLSLPMTKILINADDRDALGTFRVSSQRNPADY